MGHVDICRIGPVGVVALHGDCDGASAAAADRDLLAIEATDPEVVVLDLAHACIGPAVLWLACSAQERAVQAGRQLIVSASSDARRPFELAGLDGRFYWVEDVLSVVAGQALIDFERRLASVRHLRLVDPGRRDATLGRSTIPAPGDPGERARRWLRTREAGEMEHVVARLRRRQATVEPVLGDEEQRDLRRRLATAERLVADAARRERGRAHAY
jgi:hypothetical protein